MSHYTFRADQDVNLDDKNTVFIVEHKHNI